MQPGEVGLAFIYFDGSSELPPTDAEYEFTVNTSAADQAFYNTAPLKVTEASASGDAIVGAAVNGTGESVGGPFSVSVYCFDGDKLLSRRIRLVPSQRTGRSLSRPTSIVQPARPSPSAWAGTSQSEDEHAPVHHPLAFALVGRARRRRALIVYESESVCRDRTVAERLRNEASRLLRLAEALPPTDARRWN